MGSYIFGPAEPAANRAEFFPWTASQPSLPAYNHAGPSAITLHVLTPPDGRSWDGDFQLVRAVSSWVQYGYSGADVSHPYLYVPPTINGNPSVDDRGFLNYDLDDFVRQWLFGWGVFAGEAFTAQYKDDDVGPSSDTRYWRYDYQGPTVDGVFGSLRRSAGFDVSPVQTLPTPEHPAISAWVEPYWH